MELSTISVNEIIKKRFEGQNCAEVVSLALGQMLELRLTPLVELCQNQNCQALETAKEVLLQANAGFPGEDRSKILQQLEDRFETFFGSLTCQELNGTDLDSFEHLGRCFRITTATVRLAVQCWLENRLEV